MHLRRLLVSAVKLLLLLGITGGLYAFNRSHEKELPIIDDDDVNVTAQVTVQTGKIERRILRQYADVYGTVEPEPARAGRSAAGGIIRMSATSLVASVECTEGSQVHAGQVLLKLDTRAAQAEVDRVTAVYNAAATAEAASKSDDKILPRDKLRFDRDVADAAAAKTPAQAALNRLTIVSPISGTVLRLNTRAGEVAAAGSVAMEIADESRLVIACEAPAWSQAGISVGAPAEAVCFDVQGAEHVIPAKVSFIDPSIDPTSGSASIDVVLDSQGTTQPIVQPVGQQTGQPAGQTASPLKVGQTIHVRLITSQHQVLAVPEESVVEDAQGHATISLVERDFRWAIRRTVETGLHDEGWVELKSTDLTADQDVVTVGAFALTDKCRIEVTRQ